MVSLNLGGFRHGIDKPVKGSLLDMFVKSPTGTDGDRDGMIYDGTPQERPAPKKRMTHRQVAQQMLEGGFGVDGKHTKAIAQGYLDGTVSSQEFAEVMHMNAVDAFVHVTGATSDSLTPEIIAPGNQADLDMIAREIGIPLSKSDADINVGVRVLGKKIPVKASTERLEAAVRSIVKDDPTWGDHVDFVIADAKSQKTRQVRENVLVASSLIQAAESEIENIMKPLFNSPSGGASVPRVSLTGESSEVGRRILNGLLELVTKEE